MRQTRRVISPKEHIHERVTCRQVSFDAYYSTRLVKAHQPLVREDRCTPRRSLEDMSMLRLQISPTTERTVNVVNPGFHDNWANAIYNHNSVLVDAGDSSNKRILEDVELLCDWAREV